MKYFIGKKSWNTTNHSEKLSNIGRLNIFMILIVFN